MDYKATLNLPLQDSDPRALPLRASLPTREPEIQAYWESIDLYRLSLEREGPTFVLHDGPPYSNNDIHLGHALNKIAKDIIVKYKTMRGFRAPYVPGWDNHGMPIENEVSKRFRAEGVQPDKVTMRQRCREYAAFFVEKQKEQFKRLGVRGDWNNPYLTMSPEFEARIIEVFGELAERGYIYRGLKPVLWCADCETALADAEVEYHDHTSRSIYVRFPLLSDPNGVFASAPNPERCTLPIWTTTPWTIPANVALAVHPDADYVLCAAGDEAFLVAAPLVERFTQAVGLPEARILSRLRGQQLVGLVARHPLFDRSSPVVCADYVTMEDGTGIVHTAPGHGKEDFETGQREGLEILCPVDPAGVFTAQAGARFEGLRILGGDADRAVVSALSEADALLADTEYQHQYPHCWRCRNPLLFRATVQWFMDIDHNGHRERALRAIQEVKWYPPASQNRISSMVATRPDWCLSRQRAWGVGIPAFYCESCGKEILDGRAIRAVHDLVARESSDAWYALPAENILPPDFACPACGGKDLRKETDILDVWFDSGSTHFAVLENPKWPELQWPADVYLEGSDQHRGWFNSSLMVAVGVRHAPPYRAVITNGWTLDETGKAMHKSLGNAVSPNVVVDKLGADVLRLWVASTDYLEDVRCSDGILEQVAKTFQRIRNTLRFMVNNLGDFDHSRDAVPFDEMHDLDRWALAQFDRVVAQCEAAYESFEFHKLYHAVGNLCAVELSAFYLDVLKDRLYCSARQSRERRSAQTALHSLASGLARVLAPILSHTAEDVWEKLGMRSQLPSVQLAPFPEAAPHVFAEVEALWAPVLGLRESINQHIEAARQARTIGNPLESLVEIEAEPEVIEALQRVEHSLAAVYKVSQVRLVARPEGTAEIRVSPAPGAKCARCWLVRTDVGHSQDHPLLCGRCAQVVAEA
jgi:isoleucyl-tRNA synthetase